MPTLAVDQHEGGVRGEAAQGRRTDERGGVADGFLAHVVGRHEARNQRIHVGVALGEVVAVNYVHGNRRIRGGAVTPSGTDNRELLNLVRVCLLHLRLGVLATGWNGQRHRENQCHRHRGARCVRESPLHLLSPNKAIPAPRAIIRRSMPTAKWMSPSTMLMKSTKSTP